jgi:hypothetical protein
MKLGEGKKKNISYAMQVAASISSSSNSSSIHRSIIIDNTCQALLQSTSKDGVAGDGAADSSEDGDAAPAPVAKKSKIEKLFARQNQVRRWNKLE